MCGGKNNQFFKMSHDSHNQKLTHSRENKKKKKKKSRGPNISDEKWMLWKQTKPSDFHNEWKIWLFWKQHMVVLQKAEHRMEKWKIETIPIQTEWFENK